MKGKLAIATVFAMFSLFAVSASTSARNQKLSLLVYTHDPVDGRPLQVKGAVVTADPDVGDPQTDVTTKIGLAMFMFPDDVQFVDVTVAADGLCSEFPVYEYDLSSLGGNGETHSQFIIMEPCP